MMAFHFLGELLCKTKQYVASYCSFFKNDLLIYLLEK